MSERRACCVLKQHRSTQRKIPAGRPDEERLVADMIELKRQYGRYGYRRIAALLRDAGWQVNDTRVERLWRHGRLKVPMDRGPMYIKNTITLSNRPTVEPRLFEQYLGGALTVFEKLGDVDMTHQRHGFQRLNAAARQVEPGALVTA